jgi:hypothetical protein
MSGKDGDGDILSVVGVWLEDHGRSVEVMDGGAWDR